MDALLIGIAYGMGLLAASVGLPPLVGFLGSGFALGALGFTGGAFLHEVAHTGVLLLLFSVGLKVRFKNLAQPEVWGTGLAHLLVFSAIGTLVLGLSGLYWRPALFLGLALAFSSTVMAGKLLEEKRELRAFHGRVVIGILILQDLAAVALLAFAGAETPSVWALALFALPGLRPLLIHLLKRSGHAELLVLYGIGLALAGARLFEALGLSGELGAIVFGMMLADHPRAQELSQSLWGLKEAFLVGFFLEIGMESRPTLEALLTSLGLVLLVPLKAALFFLLLVALNLRARTAFGRGVTHSLMTVRHASGWVLKKIKLSDEFDYEAFRKHYNDQVMPLFTLVGGKLSVVNAETRPNFGSGTTLIALVKPPREEKPDS